MCCCLELTQKALVEDVACAAVDVEPMDLSGGEVNLVDVVRIGYLESRFEEFVLGVEVISYTQ